MLVFPDAVCQLQREGSRIRASGEETDAKGEGKVDTKRDVQPSPGVLEISARAYVGSWGAYSHPAAKSGSRYGCREARASEGETRAQRLSVATPFVSVYIAHLYP